jgi:hypothetical protein
MRVLLNEVGINYMIHLKINNFNSMTFKFSDYETS